MIDAVGRQPRRNSEFDRPNVIRDGIAAVLLIAGLLLPWNVHTGIGISDTPGWVLAVLVLVTLLSLGSLVVGAQGRRRGAERPAPPRLRLLLNGPYLTVVIAFVLFTGVVSIRYGGTGVVAPGVGPGIWFGVAGALLAARPPISSVVEQPREGQAARTIGWISVGLAALATLFTLYFRTRYVVPGIGGDAAVQNLTTAVAALLYGTVAIIPILIAGRWLISATPAARLATTMLGCSALLAGLLVWLLPIGRDLDAFHGIAQSTGTAGVGYEGYLAWVAAAAIMGTTAARHLRGPNASGLWQLATRSGLLLIAAWCAGTALLRIVDVLLAAILTLPQPPYNSTVLMAFDLVTAVLAAWLFVNSGNRSLPRPVLATLISGVLALTVCRLIVGDALVPRVRPLNPDTVNAVFGNFLAQQITGTFDVTLVVLALVSLAGVVSLGRRTRSARPAPPGQTGRIGAPRPPKRS